VLHEGGFPWVVPRDDLLRGLGATK
jgi:hypothetical protein